MKHTFKLSGLTCAACKKLCEMILSDISGATAVNVDLDQKTVEITSDRKIELSEVNKALEGTHYEATI